MSDELVKIAAVLSARSESELLQRISAAAQSLGFETFMFAVEIQRPFVPTLQHIASSYPVKWQQRYQANGYDKLDPTVTYCHQYDCPVVWTESFFAGDSRELLEEARSHGVGFGVSVPVHDGTQGGTMLSVARDRPLDEQESAHMVAGVQALANSIHLAASKIIVPDLQKKTDPKLTGRERQVLQLIAIGKTSWEIGHILNVSESAAVFHTSNILRKLNATSRTQAVAKAVALGLVH